jgi:hypothetical protein
MDHAHRELSRRGETTRACASNVVDVALAHGDRRDCKTSGGSVLNRP